MARTESAEGERRAPGCLTPGAAAATSERLDSMGSDCAATAAASKAAASIAWSCARRQKKIINAMATTTTMPPTAPPTMAPTGDGAGVVDTGDGAVLKSDSQDGPDEPHATPLTEPNMLMTVA